VRSIRLRLGLDTGDPTAAFDLISDFTRYPAIARDVHFVETTPAAEAGAPRHSEWEVNFRRGIMRWVERETLDRQRLRIEFEQTDGDFEEFSGTWQLALAGADEGPTEVDFEVTYDFGIESLAGIMDPIAERVIKRVVVSVLEELFDGVSVLEGGEALKDLAEPVRHSDPQPTGGS